MPPRGWLDVVRRVRAELKRDQVPLLAAGVAFFALLALVPALVSLISLYGLVADPAEIEKQVRDALAAAPQEVRQVVAQQLTSIESGDGTILALVLGVVVAIWSAAGGTGHLIDAINTAYDEEEQRGLLRRKAVSLAFTVGAIAFLLVAFAAITVVPAALGASDLGVAGWLLVQAVRWSALLGGMLVGLAVLYRYAPDRDEPKWSWVSPGAVFATVAWLTGSVLFSVYVANFASYNETYGTLAAIVVLMLWLYLTTFVVIVGAELNAELERQTAVDTTAGPAKPLGDRDAYAADTVAT